MAEKPKAIEQEAYASQYADQIAAGMDKVANRQEFTYDPLADVNYQALAKLYNKQGEQAAKNTMGDAAALNGGYGSSYAVTASQQARSDYNQQLASQIPALQEAAYNRYLQNYNMDVTALQTLQAADDAAYGRYRDDVADKQWQYGQDYQAYRDTVGDEQWQKSYDRGVYEYDTNLAYQKSRDKVADDQWAKEYAMSKKSAASSGSSSGGSNNGYLGSTVTNNSADPDLWASALVQQGVKAVTGAAKNTSKKKK